MSMDDNAMMAEVMRQSFEENPILWRRIKILEKERDDFHHKLDIAMEALERTKQYVNSTIIPSKSSIDFVISEALKNIRSEE